MIRRHRSSQPMPASLDLKKDKSAAYKERQKVIEWIDKGRPLLPKKERLKYTAYKSGDVAPALEKLFEGRCAYCESPYAVTQPVDVEHWRPKAEILLEDGSKVPGYEWLAMAWENLLPSCTDCNRSRYQVVSDASAPGGWKRDLFGKGNQFPLEDNNTRMTSHHIRPGGEKPLLLDPCEDHPEDYLDFHESGVVLPKENLQGIALKRAVESIRVYALNRKSLVDERKRQILWLETEFRMIRFLFSATADPDLKPEFKRNVESLLEAAMKRLGEHALGKVPYSQFIAARVRKFVEEELGGR